MNGYEKILKIIREQGSDFNAPVPSIATMTSGTNCKIGTLELEKDDLYYASDLIGELKKNDTVLIQQLSDEKYVIIQKVEEVD